MQTAQIAQHAKFQHRPSVPSAVPETHERFPFTISVAGSEESLRMAIEIRAAAYGRHVPELGDRFKQIEALDREDGVTVLVAESKLDHAPVGTIRIQTNRYRPLLIEQAVSVPAQKGLVLAELTRLGVCQQAMGRLAKLALFKATYQFCVLTGIDRLVIGARSPLDRQYRGLMFEDVYPDQGPIPLAYANNIPHHILYLDIPTAAQRWKAANHPMHLFLTQPDHPDISFEVQQSPVAALQ